MPPPRGHTTPWQPVLLAERFAPNGLERGPGHVAVSRTQAPIGAGTQSAESVAASLQRGAQVAGYGRGAASLVSLGPVTSGSLVRAPT
jgi:hypothetical protein